MTTIEEQDPWAKIGSTVNSIRVNEHDPWNFFWARGDRGQAVLLMTHPKAASKGIRLPHLRNIDIRLAEQSEDTTSLVLSLEEPDNKDIFYLLCRDIINAANTAKNEKEAINNLIKRTRRWHYLLRSGRTKLSLEEQKGLIGELVVLDEIMLKVLSNKDALVSWIGPAGGPKDFQFGSIAIEAKARRGGSVPYISISSEHQLDDTSISALYLHVVELGPQAARDPDSFTISDMVHNVRNKLDSSDPRNIADYDDILISSGFDYDYDYSDTHWILMNRHLYQVSEGFPRIIASEIVSGVTSVSYSITLTSCEQFRCGLDTVNHVLSGGS